MTFLILLLVLIAIVASIDKKIREYYFTRIALVLLATLLAAIKIIFSLDNKNISDFEEFQLVPSKWIRINDIIRYPIKQFETANQNYPESTVDLSLDQQNIQHRKFTIVVDKTSSFKPSTSSYAHQIASLKEYLTNNISQNRINLDSISIEDLFVFTALERWAHDSNAKTSIEILYYYGNDIFKSPFNSDTAISPDNLIEIINTCIDLIRKNAKHRGKSYTDFGKIAKKLGKKPWLEKKMGYPSHLLILSDFKHETKETGTGLHVVEKEFTSIASKIGRLTLVKLRNNLETETLNQEIKDNLNVFRNVFDNIKYYEFDSILKVDRFNYIEQISNIFSSTHKTNGKQKIILFDDKAKPGHFSGVIKFECTEEIDSVVITLQPYRPIYTKKTNAYFSIQHREEDQIRLKALTANKIRLRRDLTHKISTTSYKDTPIKYYFEFSNPGSTQNIEVPIHLDSASSQLFSILLIYLYTLFLFLIMIYVVFILCYYFLKRVDKPISYVGPIALFLILVFCLIALSWELTANYQVLIELNFFENTITYGILSLILVLFTSYHFLKSLHLMKNTIRQE